MRILVVSTHDSRGGAGKAAHRFSKEFIKQGNEVCLYVRDAKEKNSFIQTSKTPKVIAQILHALDFAPGYILSGFNKEPQFTLGLFGESLNDIVKEFKPDVIHIHWTWKGFVSFPEICRISKEIPVIWTMHDYSTFWGGVFYPYQTGVRFPLVDLLARLNNRFREKLLQYANVKFVSPSDYLHQEFNNSGGWGRIGALTINNGVDLRIFHKSNLNDCRNEYGLKKDKKYIIFGGINIVENEVKGGRIVQKAFKILEEYLVKNNIGIIAFGSQDPFLIFTLDKAIEQKFVGYIKEDESMVRLLSACNVMLVPSKQENYPFVVLESVQCTIPVVAFRVGGIPEIINHLENGYLAKPYEVEDFVLGIKYCLENSAKLKFQKSFDIQTKAKEYLRLFGNNIRS